MGLDLQKFYQACNPSKTLVVSNPLDRRYYIDFASVRGGKIIEELKENITVFSPDEPTCQLFTGHIGCGKPLSVQGACGYAIFLSLYHIRRALAIASNKLGNQNQSPYFLIFLI